MFGKVRRGFGRILNASGPTRAMWRRDAGWGSRLPVLVLVGGLAWASLLPSTRTSPIFGDEISWISVSSYTVDLVRSGRFDWKFWNTDAFGAWGPMNPPLGKLALGLPLRLGNPDPPFRGYWDWSLDEQENRARGNLPPPALLEAARKVAALHAALLVAVVCALGWEVGGIAVGLLAAGMLCLHPTWRETGPLVLTDMLLCSILVSMAFPAMALLRRPDRDRGIGPMIVLGLLLGIAAAIKPTGLVLGGMFLLAVLGLRVLRTRRMRPQVPGAVLTFLVAGGAMVALDPWLWPAPGSARPVEIAREARLAVAVARAPQPLAAYRENRTRLSGFESLVRPALVVVRAHRWRNLVDIQRTLPGLGWDRPRAIVLLDWLLFRLVAFPGEPIFCLVGIWRAVADCHAKPGEDGFRLGSGVVPALFGVVAFAYTLSLVVLPVERYLLPLLAILQLLAAQGLATSLEAGLSYARPRWGRP